MSALAVIVPIFALILAGWLVRRLGVMRAPSVVELNRYVVWLALPALLFDITAHARLSQVWQPGFIAAFGASVAAVFVVTLLLRLRRAPLADAALDGLTAAYGNVAFMGFPILTAVLGAPGLIAATIGTLITVCALFALAVVLIEAGLQEQASARHLALTVGRALSRNPLVVAPLLGAVAAIVGLHIPDPAEKALNMLGGTASPCALVNIGLFLGAGTVSSAAGKGETSMTAVLVGLKLVAQPALAYAVAAALRLSPFMTHAAVLMAALPTGTGPFMLAEFYGREARVTSKTILASTILSAVTLSACIAWAG